VIAASASGQAGQGFLHPLSNGHAVRAAALGGAELQAGELFPDRRREPAERLARTPLLAVAVQVHELAQDLADATRVGAVAEVVAAAAVVAERGPRVLREGAVVGVGELAPVRGGFDVRGDISRSPFLLRSVLMPDWRIRPSPFTFSAQRRISSESWSTPTSSCTP